MEASGVFDDGAPTDTLYNRAWTAAFTVDTSMPDAEPASATRGIYNDALSDLIVSIGGVVLAATAPPSGTGPGVQPVSAFVFADSRIGETYLNGIGFWVGYFDATALGIADPVALDVRAFSGSTSPLGTGSDALPETAAALASLIASRAQRASVAFSGREAVPRGLDLQAGIVARERPGPAPISVPGTLALLGLGLTVSLLTRRTVRPR